MATQKLIVQQTVVYLEDETGIDWRVHFRGSSGPTGNLTARVYKAGEYVATYSYVGGHANKSKALHTVRTFRKGNS